MNSARLVKIRHFFEFNSGRKLLEFQNLVENCFEFYDEMNILKLFKKCGKSSARCRKDFFILAIGAVPKSKI